MTQSLNYPVVIAELANTHGGNKDKLLQLINAYKNINYPNKAIKFQPLKPDQLALPSFSWFSVYQELYFEPNIWDEMIGLAATESAVWLDIFDQYGVEILNKNIQHVAGVKLQSSVLDNIEVINALMQTDLKECHLMINVSGHSISNVENYVVQFSKLQSKQIILQIGFQAYPTSISDTALQKVPVLRALFPNLPLCIADHAAAESSAAKQIPAWAMMAGCSYVEKHFCVNRADTKYDFYSALEPKEFQEMLSNLQDAMAASTGSFVSESESNYLKKSYQAPIAKTEISSGRLISLSDLIFRRTDQTGLTWPEITTIQNQFFILKQAIKKNETIAAEKLKKAVIGVVVENRTKAMNLTENFIQGVSSMIYCLKNCMEFSRVDSIILVTQDGNHDSFSDPKMIDAVKIFKTETKNSLQRTLEACDAFSVDIVIRVNLNFPVVSSVITERLLKSHFESGADYSMSRACAVGTSPDIVNTEALRQLAEISRGSTRVIDFQDVIENKVDGFKINFCDLPIELQRNYRLVLEYPEDHEMFNKLYAALEKKSLQPTLTHIFSILDEEPAIANLNRFIPFTN